MAKKVKKNTNEHWSLGLMKKVNDDVSDDLKALWRRDLKFLDKVEPDKRAVYVMSLQQEASNYNRLIQTISQILKTENDSLNLVVRNLA